MRDGHYYLIYNISKARIHGLSQVFTQQLKIDSVKEVPLSLALLLLLARLKPSWNFAQYSMNRSYQ